MIRTIILVSLILIGFSFSQAQQAVMQELVQISDKNLAELNFDGALQYAQQALDAELKEKGDNTINYAVLLTRIGQIYYYTGDMKKAEQYLTKAVNLIEDIDSERNPNYTKAANDLACVYQYFGDYHKAVDLLMKIIAIKKDNSGDKDLSYAKSLHNLAKIYQTLNNYEKSEEFYKKALLIKEKSVGENNVTYGVTLLNYGLLQKELGNSSEALNKVKASYKILSSLLPQKDQLIVSAKLQLALLHLESGNIFDANKIISEFEDIKNFEQMKNHPDYAPTMYNIALLYWSQKDYKRAKNALEEVLLICIKQMGKGSSLYSSCLNSLGLVCWAGKMYNDALGYLTEAVELRKSMYGENNPKYATSLHNLAGLLSYMGKKKESAEYYSHAMNIYKNLVKTYFPFLSEKEKMNFYSVIKERLDLFNCYVLENMKEYPNLISDMYDNQLNFKAILFRDFLDLKRVIDNSANSELISLYDKWRQTKEELAILYSSSKIEITKKGLDITALENQAEDYEKRLSKSSKVFSDVLEPEKITWKDIQKNLEGDEAAVEIIRFNMFRNGWSDSVFYVALLITAETKNNPKLLILDRRNELESKFIKNYNNSIRHKIDDNDSYSAFWKSIDEELIGKNRIYFSPDGIFNKINISSIKKPDGMFVLDDKNIILVSNTSDIINIKKKIETVEHRKTACLFGFPKQSTDNTEQQDLIRSWKELLKGVEFAALPQTKVEVNNIDEYLVKNQYKTTVYLEEKATEEEFKRIEKPDIVHIATHGYFLTEDDMNGRDNIFGIDIERIMENPLLRSGLILTSSEKENGILSAYEVKNMNFSNTDLVVLSACETGAGEIKNGEGVYGLNRAFREAGSKAVLMSLWKIDDMATQEFMSKFYENFLQGATLANALIMTQAKIKEKYQQPYYWGGFVLITN